MAETNELGDAIIAAANKDFSNFKQKIGDELESKFQSAIDTIKTDKEKKIFNPDYTETEPDDDPDDPEELDDPDDPEE